jgi:hypothetical protein
MRIHIRTFFFRIECQQASRNKEVEPIGYTSINRNSGDKSSHCKPEGGLSFGAERGFVEVLLVPVPVLLLSEVQI